MRRSPLNGLLLLLLLLLAPAFAAAASDAGNLVSRAEAELAKGHDLKARYLAKQALEKEPDSARAKAVLDALATEPEESAGEPEAKLVPATPEQAQADKQAAGALDQVIQEAASAADEADEAVAPADTRGVLARVSDYLGRIFSFDSGLNGDQARLLRRVAAAVLFFGGIALLVLFWAQIQKAASLGLDLQGYWGLPLAGRFPFIRLSIKIASVFARFWLHLVIPLLLLLLPVFLVLWAPSFAWGLKMLGLGLVAGVLGCIVLALSHGVWGDLLMLAVSVEERTGKPAAE